jgi:hypothetical protein
MLRKTWRWLVRGQRLWWNVAYGVFAIGLGVGWMSLGRGDDLIGIAWLVLGVIYVVLGLIARRTTGTWRKKPKSPADEWLGPLS